MDKEEYLQAQEASGFKVGDKVIVSRQITPEEEGEVAFKVGRVYGFACG